MALHLDGDKDYIFSNGKKVFVRKNSVIYLPKFTSYSVRTRETGGCYAINFDISEQISFEPFSFSVKNSGKFIECFKKAEQIWKAKKQGYIMKCKSELYNILYDMQQEYNYGYISKSKAEIIKPAIEYIHDKFTTEVLSISELSEMCSITPEYFRRLFNQFFGISPVKYINNLKLSHARELIDSEMYSVSSAAELSGFNDLSYFSREFKKAYGLSPKNYKN